ncbi:MAG: sensor domain-containing diguanylate cyclase, partial [Deferribacteres bacterium]|nr:sensor domain-containing diguanylate cyclase [Deferribacteres bacterium]
MRKILLIDRDDSPVLEFEKSLSGKDYFLITRRNIDSAVSCLKNNAIDLIVIGSRFASDAAESGEFRRLAAAAPKIILTEGDTPKYNSPPVRDMLAIPLPAPFSFRAFKYWTDKLLKIRATDDENRRLQAELRDRRKELKFYHDVSTELVASQGLKQCLNYIMEKVRLMTGAGAWSLLLDNDPLFDIIPLRSSKKIRKLKIKKGTGIAGWVLDKGVPVIVRDVLKDRRFDRETDSFPGIEVESLICAPLRMKDRDVVGVLRLINGKGGGPFTEDHMKLLLNAANFIDIAIERTFLYQKTKNDDLTNLYNIHYLNHAIEVEIERARRYRSMFSLVFMDLDNFKKVNDKYGHLIGSRVLVEIARLLQHSLRKIDIITRYGGDEFVIILPQTSLDASFLVAERLRRAIEKNIFLRDEGYPIRLTASFGVASYPDNADNKD